MLCFALDLYLRSLYYQTRVQSQARNAGEWLQVFSLGPAERLFDPDAFVVTVLKSLVNRSSGFGSQGRSREGMARIIILSQNSELFEFVAHALLREGHQVRFLHRSRVSLTSISTWLTDLIIVDAATSLRAAEGLCVGVRDSHTLDRLRILIVRPPSGSIHRRIRASGGQACLDRPLRPGSLIARVQALLDSKTATNASGKVVAGDLVIDPISYRVARSGRRISLTVSEFRLLYYMASQPGVVCRRDRLLRVIWDNPRVSSCTVDVFVRHLRQKIEEDPRCPRFIHSERGKGYRFDIPKEPSSAPLAENHPTAQLWSQAARREAR